MGRKRRITITIGCILKQRSFSLLPIVLPEFRDHIQEQNKPSTPHIPQAEEMSQFQDL